MSPGSTPVRHRLISLIIIAVLGLFLYGHTLNVPWYLDDWGGAIINDGQPLTVEQAWSKILSPRGLTVLTFAFNIAAGGLSRPGFHLVNIGIHIAAAWMVFLLLGRVFSRQRWLPLPGALLFVAHPLQTQAVTYVVQRMTSLSGLLVLASIYLFIRSRETLATGTSFRAACHLPWYGAGLFCGALALLAKESAVSLPVLLFLFLRLFSPLPGSSRKDDLRYVAPTLIAPILFALLLLEPVLSGSSSLAQVGKTFTLANYEHNDPLHYLVTQFSVVWIYLRLIVLPIGQALDYGYPVSRELLTPQGCFGLMGLFGLVALAWRLRRSHPAIACGIFWFLAALAPESSIIPLDPLFEHRLYLPMFGFILVFLGVFASIPRPAWQSTAAIAVLLPLSLLTWQRNQLWNDPVAFWKDNLRKRPQNERVCYNLSNLYREEKSAEIEELLERALQINPTFGDALSKLSELYLNQGRRTEAVRIFEDALRSNPRDVEVLNNYAEMLDKKFRDGESALRHLNTSLEIDAKNARTHFYLGRVLFRHGDPAGSEHSLRQCLALDPKSVPCHRDLAFLLRMQGRTAEADAEAALAKQSVTLRDVFDLDPHVRKLP